MGGAAFQVTRMGSKEWIISLALGFVALPLGALIRLLPNEPCARIFAFAVDQVRDDSSTFAKIRGGRMHGSSFVRRGRSPVPDPDGPHLV